VRQVLPLYLQCAHRVPHDVCEGGAEAVDGGKKDLEVLPLKAQLRGAVEGRQARVVAARRIDPAPEHGLI